MKGIHWESTPPFRVEWLSTVAVEFYRVHHLKNSLNEDLSVIIGKDGQEIEEECGRALIQEMDTVADSKRGLTALDFERGRDRERRDPRPSRGGYVGRGGRAGAFFLKREGGDR
jgi:hypothetical protein